MYINIEHYLKSGLLFSDLIFLAGIKQTNKEILETLTDDIISRFKELNLITSIKGKKGENECLKIRLSDKGKDLMVKLSYEGSPDDESKTIAEWIFSVFKNRSGGIIKNKTESIRRLYWFKTVTAIKGNFLALLIQSFFADTYDSNSGLSVKEFMEENKRGVLNQICDNICWSPPNHFARNYTLADSPLYRYYEDNKDYIEEIWKTNLDEDGNRRK